MENQKFFPEHKDKRFKNEEEFKKWLKENTAMKICFKDNGQDLLSIQIDKGGEILNCEIASQGFIWNGEIVDLTTVKVGKNIGLINAEKMHTDLMDFEIEAIEIDIIL